MGDEINSEVEFPIFFLFCFYEKFLQFLGHTAKEILNSSIVKPKFEDESLIIMFLYK